MANAGELSFRTVENCELAIISPNDPGAMVQYAEECRTLGIPFIFDPGQQCARMSGDELRDGHGRRVLVICNDYEFELIRQKTGFDEDAVVEKGGTLIVTSGENGCRIRDSHTSIDVPAVPPHRIVDPTGVGDAFRGGLLKGLAVGAPVDVCARLGSVAATYALEHLGGQSHAYTWEEFLDALRRALRNTPRVRLAGGRRFFSHHPASAAECGLHMRMGVLVRSLGCLALVVLSTSVLVGQAPAPGTRPETSHSAARQVWLRST